MHKFFFHIGDFKSHTSYLTASQRGAYYDLLLMYYDTEQPISKDLDTVSRRIGCSIEDVRVVLADFFQECDAGWSNKRCEKEISEYRAKAVRAKKALASRWSKPIANDLSQEF